LNLKKMGLTHQQKQDAIKHILEIVFDLPPDSNVHKAIKQNDILSPFDLVAMPEVEYELLEYKADPKDTDTIPLSKGNSGLLKSFKKFVLFKASQGAPIEDDAWTKITADEFNKFRVSPDHSQVLTPPSTPQTAGPDPVRDFRHGIKRDIAHFIPLKDDAAWDNWNRATVAQARAQDVHSVLDPNYWPQSQTEIDLFDEKQKYMYAAFEKTLLTDKGKALVRAHQRKYDAQKIYAELSEYALKSTTASMNASDMLTYITTVRLGDGKWKGSTHAFILHW